MTGKAFSQYSRDSVNFAPVSGNITTIADKAGRYYCFVKDNYGNE
jgi:hypothetical protein